MRIDTKQKGAVTVVRPHGPLNHEDAEAFQARLDEVSAQSLGRFVVDMSAIPYVDSRGLEALLATSEQLEHSGRQLKLCSANDTLREVFELTELTNQFEYYEDTTNAVRSFL